MAVSNYPHGFSNGLTLRGVPLAMTHPGQVFWVNNSGVLAEGGIGGSNGNPGTYQKPFETIDYAVGRCKANRGDVIMVMPGHSEDINAASALDVDVAGVAILGLGSGSNRPDLNFSDTAGTVDLAAANVILHNLTLTADVSAVVVGINVDADHVVLSQCETNFNETGDDFVTMIDCDAVDYMHIIDCRLIAEEGVAGCDEAIRLDDCDHVRISNNIITGDFTDGAIVGEGAGGVDLIIQDNVIYNADTTAGFLIDLNVAFTGIMAFNKMGTLFATAPETAVDPGSLLSIENYVCNAVDESGALVPTAVST